MNFLTKNSALLAALSLSCGALQAADLIIRVVDEQKKPVVSARVILPELDRQTRTNAQGEARFTGIEAPTALVDVEAGHSGHLMQTVSVGGPEAVMITVDKNVERIVVTSSPVERRALDMATPVEVLAGENLLRQKAITIAETVEAMPGISSSSFGPGAARPVIRGQGGARVQVLNDGLGAMDASTISADHAVTIEPLVAEQVEVLRGPATLLYGSGAIGGVVNVVDQRIPDHSVVGVTGGAELRTQTVNNERSAAVKIDAGNGRFALHADAYQRQTDNIEIPGFAERFPDEEEGEHEGEELAKGELENSDLDNDGLAIGGSWISENGMLGVSYQTFNSNYGVPGHHEHHEEEPPTVMPPEEEEADVRIGLEQTRWDAKARWDHPIAGIEHLKLRFGVNDYTHTEFEGAEIGTVFNNKAHETRIELMHHPIAGIKGVIGVQHGKRDFEAVGEEAFVPPSVTQSHSLFIVEEKQWESFRFEAGLRAENSEITPDSTQTVYDASATSWSLGAVWDFTTHWKLALSYADAQRHPFAEELYSEGPHLATQSYERGNENLNKENAKNIDLGVRHQSDDHSFSVAIYRNAVSDYIYAEATGEEIDELPVFEYQQADATLSGVEFNWNWTFARTALGDWTSRVIFDTPRGKLDNNGNLPRMPASRLGLGLDFENDRWMIGTEYTDVDGQNKTADFETPTDGYALWNAHLMYRFFTGDAVWDAFLRGSNLLNEEVRLHTSYLKDIAPQPGRSFTLGIRGQF